MTALEVAWPSVWAEVGRWKVERQSPGLGREACWILGGTGYPGKWGGEVCRQTMRRVNSECQDASGLEEQ